MFPVQDKTFLSFFKLYGQINAVKRKCGICHAEIIFTKSNDKD